LLLGTDNYGKTAWHIAAQRGNSEYLQKLWEMAKENQTPEEIKNKLLLGTDQYGRTAWHKCSRSGQFREFTKIMGVG